MKRPALWILGVAVAAIAAWQAAPALQNAVDPAGDNKAEPLPTQIKADEPAKPATPVLTGKETPMAERVATLGILNKRNGLYRDLSMKPGQAVRIGDLVVRLKACETTAPWEPEQYTGAFVQVIVHGSDDKWRKYFSGWLYKESPSLNVVEHPIYDVWTKACAMKHPDTGPDTVVIRGGEEGSGGARRSSAKKSGSDTPADAAPTAPTPAPADSAPANNAI